MYATTPLKFTGNLKLSRGCPRRAPHQAALHVSQLVCNQPLFFYEAVGFQSHGTKLKESPTGTRCMAQPEPASGGTAVAEKGLRRSTSVATTSGCSAATSKYSHGSWVIFHRHHVLRHAVLLGCDGGCGAPHLSVYGVSAGSCPGGGNHPFSTSGKSGPRL